MDVALKCGGDCLNCEALQTFADKRSVAEEAAKSVGLVVSVGRIICQGNHNDPYFCTARVTDSVVVLEGQEIPTINEPLFPLHRVPGVAVEPALG